MVPYVPIPPHLSPLKTTPTYPLPGCRQALLCWPNHHSLVVYAIYFYLLCFISGESFPSAGFLSIAAPIRSRKTSHEPEILTVGPRNCVFTKAPDDPGICCSLRMPSLVPIFYWPAEINSLGFLLPVLPLPIHHLPSRQNNFLFLNLIQSFLCLILLNGF